MQRLLLRHHGPGVHSLLCSVLCAACASCTSRATVDEGTSYLSLLNAYSDVCGLESGSYVLVDLENESTGERCRTIQFSQALLFALREAGHEACSDDYVGYMLRHHGRRIRVSDDLYRKLTEVGNVELTDELRAAKARGRQYVLATYLDRWKGENSWEWVWDHEACGDWLTRKNAPLIRLLLELGVGVGLHGPYGISVTVYDEPGPDDDEAYGAREKLARVIGGVVPARTEHLPDMIWFLEEEYEEWCRPRIARTLKRMGPRAAPALGALLRCLGSYNMHMREFRGGMFDAVCAIADQPEHAFGRLLDAGDRDAWAAGASALGELEWRAATYVPRLLRPLGGDDSWHENVRAAASRAVWLITKRAQLVLPYLSRALARGRDERYAALKLIVDMGPAAAGLVDELVSLLADEQRSRDWDGALRALAAMGPDAARALPSARRFMVIGGDGADECAIEAARAVWKLSADTATTIPFLMDALFAGGDHSGVRRSASDVLCEMGRAVLPHKGRLIEALGDERDRVVRGALSVLATFGEDAADAVDPLIALLSGCSYDVSAQAAYVLGRIGPAAARAVGALEEVASETDTLQAEKAIEALRLIRGEAVLP